jgi:hypothetical protein
MPETLPAEPSSSAQRPATTVPRSPDAPRVNQKVVQADRQFAFSNKVYRLVLVAAAIALLCLVSFSQSRLNVARDKLGLTRLTPLENAPPMLAFTTVALGGFRGLIANLLWLRATDLQEQDKYFEMVQLADWITKLQPHFVTVWVHQAWNMAYNISIKFTDPADRWQWVRRGIELLRDDGLKYNPNEVLIYRELAWFFQHKMGADLDDAHHYYKAVWVGEMNKVFGRGRPHFDELLNPQTPEAKARVDLLRGQFKMNPQWMKEVDERYGPLEWHMPETHAIYWAYVALEKTDKSKLKKDDLITCRRVIFQSLQLAFRRGRLLYPNPAQDEFIYAPNLDVVSAANRAYEQMMEMEPQMKFNIANAHKNFLKWAIYYTYVYGRETQANQWWNYLHEKYPNAVPAGQTLYDYALQRATETVGETSHDDSKAVLVGFIRHAFVALALGDDDQAKSYDIFAQRLWERFQSEVGKSKDRVGLPPVGKIKQEVLGEMLGPDSDPTFAAQLRTKLGIPAGGFDLNSTNAPAATPSTNAPAAAGTGKP